MRIPMLAIHLNRTIYTDGFNPNKQTHTTPIIATKLKDAANMPAGKSDTNAGESKASKNGVPKPTVMTDRHHPVLLKLVAEELGYGLFFVYGGVGCFWGCLKVGSL